MRTGTCHKSACPNRALHRSAALGLLLGCLTSFVACPVPFARPSNSSSDIPSGTSTLTLSVGPQASRAIVAGSTDYFGAIQAYKVIVSNVDHTYASTTVAAGVCTITDIVAGDYTVTVQAYSDAGSTTQIAQGTTTTTLSAGATTSASVTLSFTQSANTGGFSLPVQWPATTALPYICALLDSTAAAYTAVQGTSDGTNYNATISASSLSGGAHTLYLYFKASSSSTTLFGPYVESLNIWDGVTDSKWVDPSGNLLPPSDNLLPTLSFGISDFANSDATLAGLNFSGGPTLATAFNPTTYGYNFTGGSLTAGISYPFTISAHAANQGVSCTFNDVACPLTVSSPTTLTGTFTAMSGNNTLKVSVTATDRKTTQNYAVTTAALIASSTELAALATDLSGTYVLAGDIDTTTSGSWTPIGSTATPFTGTFDGAGHTITYNISNAPGDSGLFYKIGYGGLVKNLRVAGNITSSGSNIGGVAAYNFGTITGCISAVNITATGSSFTGGIVGQSNGDPISCCVSTGNVTGSSYTGGIVGTGTSPISHCYTSGTISGTFYVGGLIGDWYDGTVDQCYSTATVTGTTSAGGLIGDVGGGSTHQCTNCYARGSVNSIAGAGGFIGIWMSGSATFTACYATGSSNVGPFVGQNNAAFTYIACYSTTAQAGITTVLNAGSLPAGFDSMVWGQSAAINNGYPYLLYFGTNTQVP
ncbi:MAG TPA: cadherin-like beta sandwich domain-containing protein [Rectinemataceae bacterium]|nr:cadherin-like beta sandwich domain-containing protein [Rectinemataceae bacterium]